MDGRFGTDAHLTLSLGIYINGDMLEQTTAVKSEKEQFGLLEQNI